MSASALLTKSRNQVLSKPIVHPVQKGKGRIQDLGEGFARFRSDYKEGISGLEG
jgi:hypothetical protein